MTGGELIVMTATSPSRVRSVTELMAGIGRFLFVLPGRGGGNKLPRKIHHLHAEGTAVSLFDLSGKTAVVTGSSRGIGLAIVERMAEQGARVVVSSRNIEPCRDVAASINAKYGDGRAIAVAANISSKDHIARLVDETMRAFGRIDILVCNAASNPHYGPLTPSPTNSSARSSTTTSSPITGW